MFKTIKNTRVPFNCFTVFSCFHFTDPTKETTNLRTTQHKEVSVNISDNDLHQGRFHNTAHETNDSNSELYTTTDGEIAGEVTDKQVDASVDKITEAFKEKGNILLVSTNTTDNTVLTSEKVLYEVIMSADVEGRRKIEDKKATADDKEGVKKIYIKAGGMNMDTTNKKNGGTNKELFSVNGKTITHTLGEVVDIEDFNDESITKESQYIHEEIKSDVVTTGNTNTLSNTRSDISSDLIINTYMRSGSSFLGSIFSSRPDIFYVYEPLWLVQRFAFFMGEDLVCSSLKSVCSIQGRVAVKSKVASNTTVAEARKYLASLLNCTFYEPKTFLGDLFRFKEEFSYLRYGWNFCQGELWKTYWNCSKEPGATFNECLNRMKPICRNAKKHVLKVLRSTLDNHEELLKGLPNLKVIQLFRDPRGILSSRLSTSFYMNKLKTDESIVEAMKIQCRRMVYDIQVSEVFRHKYPDRFRVVQYEDFDDLEHKAELLYEFMKLETTDESRQRLKKLITPEGARSGFHPYNYRTKLPWKLERLIFKYCEPVYKALGYPIFKTEKEYMNTSDALMLKRLPYSL
mgnify:CR=1 FL=1